MDDEALIAALVEVKGIGRWTAEMFLIFHELRADVLPVDDIGLQTRDCAALPRRRAAHAVGNARSRARLAPLPKRRDVVPVALARPDSGRVLTPRRSMPAARHRSASLCGAHSRPRPRRAGERRASRRRASAGAQQLRESRLPGRHRGRRRRSSRSSTGPARWTDARSPRSTSSSRSSPAREIPVVAPLALAARTLHASGGFRFAVYPRCGGRAPELDRGETLEWMGRFLGRIHAVGALKRLRAPAGARHRTFGDRAARLAARPRFHSGRPRRSLAERRGTGARRRARAASIAPATCARCGSTATATPATCCGSSTATRGPHFVDFDDARMGPAVQDLWMLLSGDRADMTRQLGHVLAGYERFLRVRSARAASRRGAAHAAPAPLLRVARAALGRSGVSRGLSLVQHATLLAGPHPRAARAGRADGRAAARVRPSIAPDLGGTVSR